MTYNFGDFALTNLDKYNKFMSENPFVGYLKIRAFTSGGAVPIEGLKIVVSKDIDGDKVVFFEGVTNSSGIIEKIELPAPILDSDLSVPNRTKYDVSAVYGDFKYFYVVNIFKNVIVILNINVAPSSSMGGI